MAINRRMARRWCCFWHAGAIRPALCCALHLRPPCSLRRCNPPAACRPARRCQIGILTLARDTARQSAAEDSFEIVGLHGCVSPCVDDAKEFPLVRRIFAQTFACGKICKFQMSPPICERSTWQRRLWLVEFRVQLAIWFAAARDQ